MAVTLTTPNTILGVLEPKSTTERLLSNVAMVLIGTLLITAAAKINVPTWPVPVTLQSFAVAALAGAFGWRIGTATVIAYLIEGAIGLPFFAPGGAPGLLRFFGPTGGYLVAFPAAAFVTGAFAEHGWDKRYPTAVAAMAIGSAIIFLGGWAWFSVVTNTPPVAGFKIAVLPFLAGDVIKIALAAAVLPTGWALLKK